MQVKPGRGTPAGKSTKKSLTVGSQFKVLIQCLSMAAAYMVLILNMHLLLCEEFTRGIDGKDECSPTPLCEMHQTKQSQGNTPILPTQRLKS